MELKRKPFSRPLFQRSIGILHRWRSDSDLAGPGALLVGIAPMCVLSCVCAPKDHHAGPGHPRLVRLRRSGAVSGEHLLQLAHRRSLSAWLALFTSGLMDCSSHDL